MWWVLIFRGILEEKKKNKNYIRKAGLVFLAK
jgi:hypothetical protein